MRIAISGTHFTGKSTFIHDFIKNNSHYTIVDEPYNDLTAMDNTDSNDQLGLGQAIDQIKYSIEQFEDHCDEKHILFDRCPVDFLVYAMCAANVEDIRIDDTEVADLLPQIRDLLGTLDLIGFMPITKEQNLIYTEENPGYREKADEYFKGIYRDDNYQLFPQYNQPRIIEVYGTREERIRRINSFL